MRFVMLILCLSMLAISQLACSGNTREIAVKQEGPNSSPTNVSSSPSPPKIDRETAVNTARADFARLLGSLEGYTVEGSEEANGWHVIFRLNKKRGTTFGGGAEYLIDKETGKVLDKKFAQ